MSEVPVKALVTFHRSLNGCDVIEYAEGEVYAMPSRLATSYAQQGKVEILELAQEKPKPKRKRKTKKKEAENVSS